MPRNLRLSKLPRSWKGCVRFALDRQREYRLIPEEAEENQVVIIDMSFDLGPGQAHRMYGITPDQAAIAPDRYESCVLTDHRPCQPVRILASVAAAVDEGTRKYIVIFHCCRRFRGYARSVVPSCGCGDNASRYILSYFFASRSRISVSSTSSADGLGGAAGFSSSFFFMELMPLMTMKIANAMMTKSITVLMKTP